MTGTALRPFRGRSLLRKPPPTIGASTVWTAVFIALYALLVLRDAWLSDDAYITLRAVEQLFAGNGPVHNFDERVQGYTHPLWMLLLSGVCALTGEFYFAPLLLGVAFSLVAAWLLGFRVAPRAPAAPLAIAVLCASRALIDFSTSGLENPLTFCLVALFYTQYLSSDLDRSSGKAHFRREVLLASLLALSRLDAVLLVLPALCHRALSLLRGGRSGRSLRLRFVMGAALVASTPLLVWEVFSLVYYGSLVPNTALAKLGAGVPRTESIAQGLLYLRESFASDYPMALLFLVSPLALRLVDDWRGRMGLAGAWLSVAYVIAVGGDFMLGRFLTPAAFALLVVFTHAAGQRQVALDRALAVLALASVATPGGPSGIVPAREQGYGTHGVADERRYYAGNTGLLDWRRGRVFPASPWREAGERQAAGSATRLDAIGLHSTYSSLTARVVDEWALVDPLLARLPAVYSPTWRIGHFRRGLPGGYLELRDTGEGELRDASLAKLYGHVKRIVSGPLWTSERWLSIWLMHTGQLRKYVNTDEYRYLGARRVALDELAHERRSAKVTVEGTGVKVALAPASGSILGLELRREAAYRLIFVERGRVVHEVEVPAPQGDFGVPQRVVVALPEAAQNAQVLRVVTRDERVGRLDYLAVDHDRTALEKRLSAWEANVKVAAGKAKRRHETSTSTR